MDSGLSERLASQLSAKCNLDTYTLFLLAESKHSGCTRLAEILEGLSHDSSNRFLLRERSDPEDLFDELKQHIDVIGGTLSGDDTVIDKPYSNPLLTELIGYFWSGKHHRVAFRHSSNYTRLHRLFGQIHTCELSHLQQTGGQD